MKIRMKFCDIGFQSVLQTVIIERIHSILFVGVNDYVLSPAALAFAALTRRALARARATLALAAVVGASAAAPALGLAPLAAAAALALAAAPARCGRARREPPKARLQPNES